MNYEIAVAIPRVEIRQKCFNSDYSPFLKNHLQSYYTGFSS